MASTFRVQGIDEYIPSTALQHILTSWILSIQDIFPYFWRQTDEEPLEKFNDLI